MSNNNIQQVAIQEQALSVVCKHCGYSWVSRSKAKDRLSCSKCKTSIRLSPTKNPETGKYRINIAFIDSLAFNRAKVWAKTNGEDYITLKANKEGILSL